METHWKIHNPPISWTAWDKHGFGVVKSGLLLRLLWKHRDMEGNEKSHERTLLAGDMHNRGATSYHCDCPPVWNSEIRQFQEPSIWEECYVVAESDALVELYEGLLKESETLNVNGSEAVYEMMWNGNDMQHEVLQIRDDLGQILIPSRIVKAFTVDINNSFDYIRAEQDARQLLQELRRGIRKD